MASELIVQTLKGPTSGANANKVIIPSGQTLDASAGGFTPATGQIVQVKTVSVSGDISTSSTSTVDSGLSVSITPTSASNLMQIQVHGGRYYIAGAGVQMDLYARINGVTEGSIRLGSQYKGNVAVFHGANLYSYFHEPNSTSEQTYGIALKSSTSGQTVHLNENNSFKIYITAMEIAG